MRVLGDGLRCGSAGWRGEGVRGVDVGLEIWSELKWVWRCWSELRCVWRYWSELRWVWRYWSELRWVWRYWSELR